CARHAAGHRGLSTTKFLLRRWMFELTARHIKSCSDEFLHSLGRKRTSLTAGTKTRLGVEILEKSAVGRKQKIRTNAGADCRVSRNMQTVSSTEAGGSRQFWKRPLR
ncbi:MAG: hypothetical protein ABIO75_00760, partial [Thermomonas sp.]